MWHSTCSTDASSKVTQETEKKTREKKNLKLKTKRKGKKHSREYNRTVEASYDVVTPRRKEFGTCPCAAAAITASRSAGTKRCRLGASRELFYVPARLAGCLPTWLTRCSRNRYAGQPVTIATSSTIRAVVGLGEKYLVVAGIPRLRWLPAERASVNHPEFRETVKPNFSRKRKKKKSLGGQLLSEEEEDFSSSSFLVQLDR